MRLWFPTLLLLTACTFDDPPPPTMVRPAPSAANLSEAERLLEAARARAAAEDKRILVHVGSPG